MGEKSKVLLKLFGVLDVTGEVVGMLLIVLAAAVVSLVVKFTLKERPGKFQNIVETCVEYLDNFFSELLGKAKARKYFPFLASLFVFIAFSNYLGLIPGVGLSDYLKAPSASLSVTAGLGAVTFLFLQFSGLRCGVRSYFRRFVSPMFFMLPLLVLDEVIKPVSLSLRLYGNIFGEETVTEELYNIFPVGPPVIMMVLSLLFAALQAMVYTMLVSIYLDEATELTEQPAKRAAKKAKKKKQIKKCEAILK